MSSLSPVLVLFAHPALEKSKVNVRLLDAISALDGVTVHDLYERYPDFDVDPDAEQELLSAHEVVVMQHPLHWYSTPAMLKQWQDLVLQHGWAYGSEGRALEGKILFNALTTGGGLEAYQPGGFHDRTLMDLLAPLRQTAQLCRMRYLPPFVCDGAFRRPAEEFEQIADDYRRLVVALRDRKLDVEHAMGLEILNRWDDESATGQVS